MVTGDNIVTARAIAQECGILTTGGAVIEGREFRNLTEEQFKEILPKLEVRIAGSQLSCLWSPLLSGYLSRRRAGHG